MIQAATRKQSAQFTRLIPMWASAPDNLTKPLIGFWGCPPAVQLFEGTGGTGSSVELLQPDKDCFVVGKLHNPLPFTKPTRASTLTVNLIRRLAK